MFPALSPRFGLFFGEASLFSDLLRVCPRFLILGVVVVVVVVIVVVADVVIVVVYKTGLLDVEDFTRSVWALVGVPPLDFFVPLFGLVEVDQTNLRTTFPLVFDRTLKTIKQSMSLPGFV